MKIIVRHSERPSRRNAHVLQIAAEYTYTDRDWLTRNRLWKTVVHGTFEHDSWWALLTGKTNLHITFASLERGHTIFCDTPIESDKHQRAIIEGCESALSVEVQED